MCKNIRKKKTYKNTWADFNFSRGKIFHLHFMVHFFISGCKHIEGKNPKCHRLAIFSSVFFSFLFTHFTKRIHERNLERKNQEWHWSLYILPTYYFWHTCVFDVYCLRKKTKKLENKTKTINRLTHTVFFLNDGSPTPAVVSYSYTENELSHDHEMNHKIYKLQALFTRKYYYAC